MYKIHINVSVIIFCSEEAVSELKRSYPDALILKYLTGKKQLLNYIDMLEKRKDESAIVVYSENFKEAYLEFKSLFTFIKAAGGLVLNPEGKLLVIYRRGHWDLPKGKVDSGETIPEAAIREVEEETGLKILKIVEKLGHTYHTYHTHKKKRILKKTHWYIMETIETELSLQYEEDIEHAIWIDPQAFIKQMAPIYHSIQGITTQLLNHRNAV